MAKRITIILCMAFSVSLTGCFRRSCERNRITPAFIGFSLADIDTLVVRAYTPGDNYQHLVDTALITYRNTGIYTIKGDTIIVDPNAVTPDITFTNPKDHLSVGFDWQIYIPAKKRTILISNIITELTEGYNRGCVNPINSILLDSQFTIPPILHYNNGFFPVVGYMAYIHNQP